MAKICIYCGSELQEGDVYCGSCGSLTAGSAPPDYAWSKVSADLAAAPKKKKKGCLTALLIFIVIAALLAAAFYFLVLRRLKDGSLELDLDLSSPQVASAVLAPDSLRAGAAPGNAPAGPREY